MSQQTGSTRHKVIALCGSRKFADTFQEVAERLTLSGAIVLRPEFVSESKWADMSPDEAVRTHAMLAEMHRQRIDMADEAYVVDVGGYIGYDTSCEIAYAEEQGKAIAYHEPPTFRIMMSKTYLSSQRVITWSE